jgi:Protein of unknown function (DUF3089).
MWYTLWQMKTLSIHALRAVLISFAASPLFSSAPRANAAEATEPNWLMLPAAPEFEADVFYVHPTTVSNEDTPLMDWNDLATRAKTLAIAKAQTGPFASFANIHAPFCRQLEFNRALRFLKTGDDSENLAAVGEQDAIAAFDYYIERRNNGRPFFLLGHSQGAGNLLALLKRGFNDDAVRSRFVAAYLIGVGIQTNEAGTTSGLRFASGADDTGVVVSYNAQSAAAAQTPFTGKGVYGINPLNWRVDATPADKSLNLGAVLYNWSDGTAREVANFCGAVLDPATGALIVEPSDDGKYDARRTLGEGVYHMNDIYFFFRNIEQNAKNRLEKMTP